MKAVITRALAKAVTQGNLFDPSHLHQEVRTDKKGVRVKRWIKNPEQGNLFDEAHVQPEKPKGKPLHEGMFADKTPSWHQPDHPHHKEALFEVDRQKKDVTAKREKAQARLDKLNNKIHGPSHTKDVAKHFHLGTVGGSGRNVSSLNRKRAAELDRTVDAAKEATKLYKEIDGHDAHLERLENGTTYRNELKAAEKRKAKADKDAEREAKPRPVINTRKALQNMRMDGRADLEDGSKMHWEGGWDEEAKDTFAHVLLTKPNGEVMKKQAKSIQGSHISDTAKELLKEHLKSLK